MKLLLLLLVLLLALFSSADAILLRWIFGDNLHYGVAEYETAETRNFNDTCGDFLENDDVCVIDVFAAPHEYGFTIEIHSRSTANIALKVGYIPWTNNIVFTSVYRQQHDRHEKTMIPFREDDEVKIRLEISREGFSIIFDRAFRKFYHHRLDISKFNIIKLTADAKNGATIKISDVRRYYKKRGVDFLKD